MYGISASSVSEAFHLAFQALFQVGQREKSRNGDVMVFPTPVVTEYTQPMNRVIFYPFRDANPYFHLFETLWMLAGREDLRFVKAFNARMATYSDDGSLVRGSAYGKRWKSWFNHDQIKEAVRTLGQDQFSRRVVLSQWDPHSDPVVSSKDIPCNTHCYLRVNKFKLDLTVCNRSNDMIFGCYGSNAVHFSMLQEYIASHLGLKVGTYYQFSNNLHSYCDNEVYKKIEVMGRIPLDDPYDREEVAAFPMREGISGNFGLFDADLEFFFKAFDNASDADIYSEFSENVSKIKFNSPFFTQIVVPMLHSYALFKKKDFEAAVQQLEQLPPNNDWKKASREWLIRRQHKTQ